MAVLASGAWHCIASLSKRFSQLFQREKNENCRRLTQRTALPQPESRVTAFLFWEFHSRSNSIPAQRPVFFVRRKKSFLRTNF